MNRRDLIKTLLATAPLTVAGRVWAAPSTDARLLVVFLRGAYDAARSPTGLRHASRAGPRSPRPDVATPSRPSQSAIEVSSTASSRRALTCSGPSRQWWAMRRASARSSGSPPPAAPAAPASGAEHADPALDHIKVRGKLINPLLQERERVYVLLNKPKGYLSSVSDPEDRPLVTDLLPPSLGTSRAYNIEAESGRSLKE